MMCCQNSRIEDDLDSLNSFIKTMRESIQGMRVSLNSLNSSAKEFHQTINNRPKTPNNEYNPSKDQQENNINIE